MANFNRQEHVYSSLDFEEIIKDTIRFFNGTSVYSLPAPERFHGTGVYAIYCVAKSGVYKELHHINRTSFDMPIYIGKAVPKGWRQGRFADHELKSYELCSRIIASMHKECDLIGTVEAALIRKYRPIWNTLIDGFGNHDPGSGRYQQAKSGWDICHSGRAWAEKCQGGLATGLGECDVEHAGFIEWNKHACATLRHNHDENRVWNTDVCEVDFGVFENIDIVAGAPPCQPFSLAGKHKGSLDSRDMFPQASRAISECRPKAFIFENVKGLLRESFSLYFEYILLRLSYPDIVIRKGEKWKDHQTRLKNHKVSGNTSGLCYKVTYSLVDAADYGIPQRRERVIIVGIREDLNLEWICPKPSHSLDSLIWDQYVSGEYWERHGVKAPARKCYDKRILDLIERTEKEAGFFSPELQAWRTIRDQLAELPEPDDEGSFNPEHLIRRGARSYPGHTGSFIDLPSKTLKAGDHGVPGGENMIRFHDGSLRYFTTYEAKRIQTFPRDYRILGSWTESMRQIGNAVPVHLGRVIAKSVIESVWSEHTCNVKRWTPSAVMNELI